MNGTQSRIEEILGRIEAWTEQHAEHTEAGADCGCDLYNDVIYPLPEYDPLDPGDLQITGSRRYALLDGSVIDGTHLGGDGRPEWRVIPPG